MILFFFLIQKHTKFVDFLQIVRSVEEKSCYIVTDYITWNFEPMLILLRKQNKTDSKLFLLTRQIDTSC